MDATEGVACQISWKRLRLVQCHGNMTIMAAITAASFLGNNRKISQNLVAMRYVLRMVWWVWNFTSVHTTCSWSIENTYTVILCVTTACTVKYILFIWSLIYFIFFLVMLQQRLRELGTSASCHRSQQAAGQACQGAFHWGSIIWIWTHWSQEDWRRGRSNRRGRDGKSMILFMLF